MPDTTQTIDWNALSQAAGLPSGGGSDPALSKIRPYLGDVSKFYKAEQNDPAIAKLRNEKAQSAEDFTKQDIFQHVQPFQPLPPPDQRQYQTDPLQTFFSLGSVFGILASAFTHQPWSTGINAAAAAINARNKGDATAYQHAFNEWRINNDLMMKRHDAQMQDWTAIADKFKDDQAGFDAAITAHEAKYDDPAAKAMRMAGMWGQYYDLMNKRIDTGLKLKEALPGVVEGGMMAGAALKLQQAMKTRDPAKIDEAIQNLRAVREGLVTAKNPAVTEAAEGVDRLQHGENTTYGGWTFTPKDLKDIMAAGQFAAFTAPSPKEKALAKMLTDAAAAPYGTTAPAAPSDHAGAPSAGLAGELTKLPHPQTQAQFDALPPGAFYIDPTGGLLRKRPAPSQKAQ